MQAGANGSVELQHSVLSSSSSSLSWIDPVRASGSVLVEAARRVAASSSKAATGLGPTGGILRRGTKQPSDKTGRQSITSRPGLLSAEEEQEEKTQEVVGMDSPNAHREVALQRQRGDVAI